MLLTHATLATISSRTGYGLLPDGAVHIDDETIGWVGRSDDLPGEYKKDRDIIDCRGNLVTPGLIDCHTHLVYAGDRSREFEMRLAGMSYEQISKQGGGIVSTVAATRRAGVEELVRQSFPRLRSLVGEGVTTVEIKSGYGLDSDNEIKMLQAAQRLADHFGIGLQKTFLGAHAPPPQFSGNNDGYIDLVCRDMLPAAHELGLVDAVDAFCERIAFTVEQAERVFSVAQSLNLPIKLHAEQFSSLGGAKMAASMGALSVDHLEYLQPRDTAALAASGTVAVLLPGAFYFLGETKPPPIDSLRKNEVPMAVATDSNPGSSPLTSILSAMSMACHFFSLTAEEALRGTTINAAKALGLDRRIGSLEPGKNADLVLWNLDNPAALSYNIGLNPCNKVMRNGKWLAFDSPPKRN